MWQALGNLLLTWPALASRLSESCALGVPWGAIGKLQSVAERPDAVNPLKKIEISFMARRFVAVAASHTLC
jgi:hypothetical protein